MAQIETSTLRIGSNDLILQDAEAREDLEAVKDGLSQNNTYAATMTTNTKWPYVLLGTVTQGITYSFRYNDLQVSSDAGAGEVYLWGETSARRIISNISLGKTVTFTAAQTESVRLIVYLANGQAHRPKISYEFWVTETGRSLSAVVDLLSETTGAVNYVFPCGSLQAQTEKPQLQCVQALYLDFGDTETEKSFWGGTHTFNGNSYNRNITLALITPTQLYFYWANDSGYFITGDSAFPVNKANSVLAVIDTFTLYKISTTLDGFDCTAYVLVDWAKTAGASGTYQGLYQKSNIATQKSYILGYKAFATLDKELPSLKEESSQILNSAYVTDTAIGTIASFPDGADNMPVKSLKVNIEPVQSGSGDPSPDNVRPISGRTSAKVTRTGKNLLKSTATQGTTNGITFTPNADGSINVTGTATANAYFNIYAWVTPSVVGLPTNAPLVISGGTTQARLIVSYRDPDGTNEIATYDEGNGATVTIPSTDKNVYIGLRVLNGVTVDTTIYPMIRPKSDTDATFTPYQGQTVTINLGGTRYGGTLNVETGVLTVTHGIADLGDYNWDVATKNQNGWAQTSGISAKAMQNAREIADIYCTQMKPESSGTVWSCTVDNTISVNTTGATQLYWSALAGLSAADAKAKLSGIKYVYPLATPQTVQLTANEISTVLGQNNIWNDCGDTDVEYRADTKLYIQYDEAISLNFGVDGDSITAGNQWSYYVYNKLGYKTHHNVGVGSSQWQDEIVTYNGTTYYPQIYGQDGWLGMSDGWDTITSAEEAQKRANNSSKNHILKFIDEVNQGTYPEPDIFVFALGTNDDPTRLGTVDAAFASSSLPSVTDELLRTTTGAMRWCIQKIHTEYPKCKIFWSTPIQSTNDTRQNANITKIPVMTEVANRLSAKIIDQWNDSGISAIMEKASAYYLRDGIHPNANGVEAMGRLAVAELANY